ncbi:sodium-coupled neutral amino acid transporter 7-like [Macrobrachium rosenbergii]|uniref:sodium-coupled neutral amino acid transporter 7-like n=1 Tax=Macrobrachium rosenbergii TaxID=79674 RepID=UPI0034D5CC92
MSSEGVEPLPFVDNADTIVPISVVSTEAARRSRRNRSGPRQRPSSDRYVVGLVTPHVDHEGIDYDDDDDTNSLLGQNHEQMSLPDDGGGDILQSCLLDSAYGDDDDVGISWVKAMFLIVNAGLGAGLLNFPEAFHKAGGIVLGNVIHVIFTACALGSLLIIGRCASERNCKTYQELILHMCNPCWSVVASMFISLYCFITCITFIIIIGDQFDRVFASYIGMDFCHRWYLHRKFTMTISSLPLIFPSCFKRIDGLRFMSYVGVLSIFYLMAIIVEEFYMGNYPKGPVIIYDSHWSEVVNVLPTICFGYQCHVSSVPIYSCLKKQDGPTFAKACMSAIFVCLTIYTISANYGYLTFGSLVNGDVLLSYDARKVHVFVAVILLGIKSWTTYPILLFCVREAVSDLYIQMKSLSPVEASLNEPARRRIIAIVLWVSSILMAAFTPNIDIVVKLLGSLAAFFIFVFPGMSLLQLVLFESEMNSSTKTWREIGLCVVGILYVMLGMFTFGLAFVLGVENMIDPDESRPLCE